MDPQRPGRGCEVLVLGRRPFSLRPEPGGPSAAEVSALGVGRGEYDPVTGLYEWYEGGLPPASQAQRQGKRVTRTALLEQWPLVEADFQDTYGLDLDAPGLMRERSWRWFQTRLYGLLSADSRISRHFAPPPPQQPRTPRRR